ncbi:MAG: hypothetical protein EB141_07220, partial [Verrucomicrobia bacterium]|nr:hypothetical protein [Verrucomicrobiota bacterium]
MKLLRPALLCIATLILTAAAHAAGPETFKVSEFTFKRPASWEWVEVASAMRKAQLKVTAKDAKEPGEVVFFFFGPQSGGTKANVDRWLGQFEEGRDKINAKTEEKTVGKVKVKTSTAWTEGTPEFEGVNLKTLFERLGAGPRNSTYPFIDKRDDVSGNVRPWGMGPRVPMYVISPWSRGGWVSSEVFDHTSVGRFIEARFGVTIPAITPWSRAVSGDLTSAFDFKTPNREVFPRLP